MYPQVADYELSGANWVDTKFRSLDNGAHYFSGSLTISSSATGDGVNGGLSLSASGKVSASYFYGDGSQLSNITIPPIFKILSM